MRASDKLHDEIPGLAELTDLYRQAERERPSVELDQYILAAARKTRARRPARWWIPLSMAATLVLAIGLLDRMREQLPPEQSSSPERATAIEALREERARSEPREQKSMPADAAPALLDRQRVVEPEPTPAAAPMPSVKPEVAEEALVAEPEARLPEQWLKDIAELRAAGKMIQAEAELRRFRQRYPDYPTTLLDRLLQGESE